ncbi:MAG: hypothetical protein Q9220_005920 [cf. Caloplaca sp. 1 TL-2023]
MALRRGLSRSQRTIPAARYVVIGVDISPHMKPDDMPDNFSPQVHPKQRRVGEAMRTNIDGLLSTFAIFPFTRRLGMSVNAVNDLVSRARVDVANAQLKPYFPL